MAISAGTLDENPTRSFPRTALSRARLKLAIMTIGCALLPGPAAAYVEYGFDLVDNSAGGGPLDEYVTQEFWADTEMRWFGTQLRLELQQGSIFQGELDGSGFMTEYNHDLLATLDPALQFDTRVGVNGEAPSVVLGNAINLGAPSSRGHDDAIGAVFSESELNIAFGPGGGEVFSGALNFGTITLSTDAVGQGAFMFSLYGEEDSGHYAQTFEVDGGVMRLTGEQVNLLDPDYYYALEDFEFVRQERSRPAVPDEEPEQDPAPPVSEDPPPVIDLPPDTPIDTDPEMPGESHEPVGEDGNPSGGTDDLDIGTIDFDLGEAVPISWDFSDDALFVDFDLGSTAWKDLAAWNAGFAGDSSGVLEGVLRSLDGTAAELYATGSGDLLIPRSTLSEGEMATLLASRNWSLDGDNLVFHGSAGIPEPGSAVLLLVAAAATLLRGSQRSRGC